MDAYKNMSVWDLLIFLQEQVRLNADSIKNNTNSINRVDSKDGATPDLLRLIRDLTLNNANLSSENVKYLNLFNSLLEVYRKFGGEFNGVEKAEKQPIKDVELNKKIFQDCIVNTANGAIELTESHPFISDKGFLKELLEVLKERENYEMCLTVRRLLERLG